MAFSQLVQEKGQAAMMCQLCENDQKLKWKCLECELMMCQRCRDKVHPKFASAQNHTIIDIKEKGKYQIDSKLKPDLTILKCEDHKGQKCCLYCVSCQELVCHICITKTHNKHEFGDINEEYKIKMEKIRNGQKNIEKESRTLTISEQKLKQINSNEKSNYDKVKQEILDNDKALKNEIQKHTDKLLKELDQKWKDVTKHINDELEQLAKQQRQIQKQTREINTLLQPSNVKDVISVSDSMLKSMETKVSLANTLLKGVPKFTQGDKTKISHIFRELKDVTFQINTELQIDNQFKTDLKGIISVVPCPDDSFWICDYMADVVEKVKPQRENVSDKSIFEIDVHDAALLPFGDLLMSDVNSSNLKLIPAGSTDIKDSVYTVAPIYPIGIHVSRDNKVIVAAADSYDIPPTGARQIIVMDQTGHREKVFQYDRNNEPLFTYPYSVTSNSDGFIAVVDWASEGRDRVVILDRDGEVRNIYKGHPDVNNEDNQFNTTSITTTPSDNFVVADKNNHTLHVLNCKGELITFYNTEEMGILLPNSLSFSTTGQLYIGCNTYDDDEDKADIFVINNFIF